MQDKIVQITSSLGEDGELFMYGLSESGKLYRFMEIGHWEKYDKTTDGGYKQRYITEKRYWELILESPNG